MSASLEFGPNGPDDQPGVASAQPFVFEVGGTEAQTVQDYFDNYQANPESRSMSLVIDDLANTVAFRWNLFDYVPEGAHPGADGRTRFRLTNPTSGLKIQADPVDPFGDQSGDNLSCNPQTDTHVEIAGVTNFCPQVQLDDANRTLTFTFDFVEGGGILPWVKRLIEGVPDKRSLSVIEEQNGQEISRMNYYGCFPMEYKQFTGFALPAKIKARVVLSFDKSEMAN